jgi:cephalosporin hydroxylase
LKNPHDQFLDEVRENIAGLAVADELRALSRKWLCATSKHRYSYNFSWLGRPIIQYPQDIVALQELVWRVRPDLIIETGIAHGGSLILSASLLSLLDYTEAAAERRTIDPSSSTRRVIGIDIEIRSHNRAAIEAHPLGHLIEMIEGSSTAKDVVRRVRERALDFSRILICLDSHHTAEHVMGELCAYAPLVTPGSYCVVFDTVIENMPDELYPDRPWRAGNSPMTAVDRFLSELTRGESYAADGRPLAFEIDDKIDSKLMISVAPRGYLRRLGA